MKDEINCISKREWMCQCAIVSAIVCVVWYFGKDKTVRIRKRKKENKIPISPTGFTQLFWGKIETISNCWVVSFHTTSPYLVPFPSQFFGSGMNINWPSNNSFWLLLLRFEGSVTTASSQRSPFFVGSGSGTNGLTKPLEPQKYDKLGGPSSKSKKKFIIKRSIRRISEFHSKERIKKESPIWK